MTFGTPSEHTVDAVHNTVAFRDFAPLDNEFTQCNMFHHQILVAFLISAPSVAALDHGKVALYVPIIVGILGGLFVLGVALMIIKAFLERSRRRQILRNGTPFSLEANSGEPMAKDPISDSQPVSNFHRFFIRKGSKTQVSTTAPSSRSMDLVTDTIDKKDNAKRKDDAGCLAIEGCLCFPEILCFCC
ncbi:hypothetical protein M408DRAFT_24452 [Serendipita vermifera MAFF 305830]|uniref:Uncharacterized protein n=1 Tax=Serendipita vermifera MAFF 305830 TaxID=933852 RepID=A0A0C3B5Q3_SERVB|nr:hypothetical protein M408DRAFT_24452 [Serendipita vermifera MAFF 305830]